MLKKCESKCEGQVLWQREPFAYLVPLNGAQLHLAAKPHFAVHQGWTAFHRVVQFVLRQGKLIGLCRVPEIVREGPSRCALLYFSYKLELLEAGATSLYQSLNQYSILIYVCGMNEWMMRCIHDWNESCHEALLQIVFILMQMQELRLFMK